MTLRRRPSRTERDRLWIQSGEKCGKCAGPITRDSFHVAHLRAVASGGATVPDNLAAWCAPCNLAQGARDAADPRLGPRGWQIEGLTDPFDIPMRICRNGVATVAAAPGAGKTLFAALVFESLYEVGFVDRLVVFAPRRTLVKQWKTALYTQRFLDLDMHQELERAGSEGTIVTYQSLSPLTVESHRWRASQARTLIVFDEVHHIGEPDDATGRRPAWAQYAMEIAGSIDALNVAGVLNLSGTLWRSSKGERISTVKYAAEDGGKWVSVVDLEVEARRLIREGYLRPVDLYRCSATVTIVDLNQANRIVSPIADLDDQGPARTALRQLSDIDSWRRHFVEAVVDRLKIAYDSVKAQVPAKALIVAANQRQARSFLQTANEVMRARGFRSMTELAISDEPAAPATLERFRNQKTPGILVTVDMAGEGYDCPEIMVLGFATNKLTPLYVRQVVARAQRVTDYERRELGRALPAAIVVPDVPLLVEHMRDILEPMRHEIQPEAARASTPTGEGRLAPRYTLDDVTDLEDGNADGVGLADSDTPMELIRVAEPRMQEAGLPVAETLRMLWAGRKAMRDYHEAHPFTALAPEDLKLAEPPAPRPERRMRRERMAETEIAERLQRHLAELGKWWQVNGDTPVEQFNLAVNQAGGIPGRGGRAQASVEQLRRAQEYAHETIRRRCEATGLPLPKVLRF